MQASYAQSAARLALKAIAAGAQDKRGLSDRAAALKTLQQTLADPAADHDWVIEADVDLDASDEIGELVLHTSALRRL